MPLLIPVLRRQRPALLPALSALGRRLHRRAVQHPQLRAANHDGGAGNRARARRAGAHARGRAPLSRSLRTGATAARAGAATAAEHSTRRSPTSSSSRPRTSCSKVTSRIRPSRRRSRSKHGDTRMTNKQTEAAIGLLLSSRRHMGAGDRALLELFRSTGRLPVPPLSEGAPPKRTYIASSKRNPSYPGVVIRARETGYEVHDWSDPPLAIDPDCQNWTCSQYIAALRHSPAREHFENYKRAIEACDACVLLLPAGTDAHA